MSRDPVNVAAHLPRLAQSRPDALAVVVARKGGYASMTAAELDRRSDRIAHALHAAGIREGTRTVLMVKPSLDFFALTFAMLKLGAVFVMVDPGMGLQNLGVCLAEAQPTAFIGVPKAHWARWWLGWARDTLQIRIAVGAAAAWAGPRLEQLEARAPATPFPCLEPPPEQTAAILFTSGGTGVPKGVVTPYGVFAAQVRLLREVFRIEPGERDLATFPLFALFGPALGMTSVVPDMDASRPATADPVKLVAALEDHACTNMFASPAVVDRLGRYGEAKGLVFSSLRRVLSSGAPASLPSLERMQRCLPQGVEVSTPYGATEALPIAVAGSRSLLGDLRPRIESGGGICVGHPVPGIEVAILPIQDAPIEHFTPALRRPTGEIGEIAVSGPIVTASYYGRPEATRLAKMRDDAGRLWHRMGDVGYLDEDGRLWMCGRKAHRVELGATVLFTLPCEAVFNTHPDVARSALVGARVGGERRAVLCVELDPQAGRVDETTLFEQLHARAQAFPHTRLIDTFRVHPRFPVDVRHNSKIFREQLAAWVEERG